MKMAAEEKKTGVEFPTVVLTPTETVSTSDAKQKLSKKKYVIIAVSALVTVVIVVIAILVGMYMFTEGQKEILKATLTTEKDTTEEITSDPNSNVMEYHIQNKEYEMWLYDDFNKDIQVSKITTGSGTNCYISPLNRTFATEPAKLKSLPDENAKKKNDTANKVYYGISDTPVSDTSFLNKKARDACAGISTYWLYPTCSNDDQSKDVQSRQKRCYRQCYWYSYYCCCNYCYDCTCTQWRCIQIC